MFTVRKFVFTAIENTVLPKDYYNCIPAWIYKNLSKTNHDLGDFLHNEGYQLENKHRYKLFSPIIYIEGAKYQNDKYFIQKGSKVFLELRGKRNIVDTIAAAISEFQILELKGRCFILDKELKINKPDLTKETILFETKTAITTTTKDDCGKTKYVPLMQTSKFLGNIWDNALRKYKLVYGYDFNSPINICFKEDWIKSQEIFIKGNKQMGYKFRLEISTSDINMKNIIFYLGFGEKNVYGFGQVKIAKEV